MKKPDGKKIRYIRDCQGIPAYTLADAVGISPEHLSNIEHGRREIPCDLLPAVAKQLNNYGLLTERLHTCPVYMAAMEYQRQQKVVPLRKAA